MAIDPETARQVALSLVAVLVFILAASAVSATYGSNEMVDRQVEGTLAGAVGDLSGGEQLRAEFSGTVTDGVSGQVNGTLVGSVNQTSGNFTGTLDGSISGTVDGTIQGDASGSLNRSAGTFQGQLDGTVEGTSNNVAVTSTGGLAIVGLMILFILLMAVAGLWLARQDFDSG
jgi:hypothetical protein